MRFLFTVDQEFDTVSGFLLKRTKDMVNKYRQLLVRETQVRPPSFSAPACVSSAPGHGLVFSAAVFAADRCVRV